MPSRHPALISAWVLLFVASIIGWVVPIVALAVLPLFASMVVAIITYRNVDPGADLAHRRTYRALLGLLLVTAAATTIASGSTLFISATAPLPVVGLTVLGATNLVVVVLTWRALVAPSTRRAALAGMVAVLTEAVAMGFDVGINMHVPGFGEQPETGLALLGAMVSIVTGSLACVAALVTFGPDLPDVPEARLVDRD